jgi:hypothetical protein
MGSNHDRHWCCLAVLVSAIFCLLMLSVVAGAKICKFPVPFR